MTVDNVTTFIAKLHSLKMPDGAEDLFEEFYNDALPYMTFHRDTLIMYYTGLLERGNTLNEYETRLLKAIESSPEIGYWLVYFD